MNKELYVSSTPHETKVGMVEDDLLAEIYLERENEYTLAGSIYKGRVTRVLPGMQSAFVDVGLERDAFLYVSDFMELPDEDEVDEIPIRSQPHTFPQPPQQVAEASSASESPAETAQAETQSEDHAEIASQPSETPQRTNGGEQRDSRNNDWRNRRRRGRGRRGERMPESRYARPTSESPRTDRPRGGDYDYGPPPGYQPIVLPGESISKYQRMAPAPARGEQSAPEGSAPVAGVFPNDEPLFAEADHQGADVLIRPQSSTDVGADAVSRSNSSEEISPWDADAQRQHRMNVAAVFGTEEETSEHTDTLVRPPHFLDEEKNTDSDDLLTTIPEHSDESPVSDARLRRESRTEEAAKTFQSASGTLEEEVIDDEETDTGSYVKALEEDAAFEEMEEETQHAADYHPQPQAIAASAEPVAETGAVESIAPEAPEMFEDEQAIAEEEAEDAELEEAQAEAEALLDAEARGNGTVDAHAEVRAPSGTSSYTQRAFRPAYDRRGQRGRRGGRRFRRQEPHQLPQITDLLKEGQEILVQIAKEPIAKKGARITSHIALPGRFLVYMPTVNHTGVSRKISSEEERQRLKRIILSERENGHGGFIVRTAAQGASEDELRADIRFLKGLWSEIKTRAEMSKAPALIYHDLNVVERILRDQVTSDFSAVWVDNEQEYERILRFANRFQPGLVKRVKLYTKETPLFDQFGLTEEVNKALKSKVWLKSGGYIVINQAEALVAIDVNTGKYVGKTTRLEDTIVKTNVDAIKEIVRQIRLRDLGGIIIIDFIDMDERRNRQKVMQALEEALRSDRSPSKVLQFNDFGLVAITRKRVKQSLERTIGTPCPYCQSTGFVKSATTICNEIYLEMRKMAKHLEHSDVILRVNPEVAKALKAGNGRLLNEMEELAKKTVIVKSDPALHQEQFDIN